MEINDDSRGTYNTNSHIKFKTSILKSSLCDYSDSYILLSGTMNVLGARPHDAAVAADRNNKQAIFKNCAPFTDNIIEINNKQMHNERDLDVVTSTYHLIEYSDNYSKTSGSLYQFCRDEPNNNIKYSKSLKLKSKFLDNTINEGIVNAKIAVPLKYLSNISRTLKMPWINFELIIF